MRKFGLIWMAVVALTTTSANAAEGPKFRDYPASLYRGLEKPFRPDSEKAELYAEALRAASEEQVNFAGRYVFVPLSTGTQCETGAAIDVKTGRAHFLPVSTCFWGSDSQPFYYKANSRLLVLGGQLGEAGEAGAHYYTFDGKEFRLLKSIPKMSEGDDKGPQSLSSSVGKPASYASIEPSAGPSSNQLVAKLKRDPVLAVQWACYEVGVQAAAEEIAKQSSSQKDYVSAVLMMGGFITVGDKVRHACDDVSRQHGGADYEKRIAAVSDLFLLALLEQDEEILKQCASNPGEDWRYARLLCERHRIKIIKGTNGASENK